MESDVIYLVCFDCATRVRVVYCRVSAELRLDARFHRLLHCSGSVVDSVEFSADRSVLWFVKTDVVGSVVLIVLHSAQTSDLLQSRLVLTITQFPISFFGYFLFHDAAF